MFATQRLDSRVGIARFARMLACLAAALLVLAIPVPAAIGQDTPSGLQIPRFASTRSAPVNVRVGPGTNYEIEWVFVKAGIPVEVIQEFDTWRHIRDVEGEDGWVHQNLLVGDRVGYIAPWSPDTQVPLLSAADPDASTRAILGSGMRIQVAACDGTWCEVRATHQPEDGRPRTYSGYVEQGALWGVYQSEIFD